MKTGIFLSAQWRMLVFLNYEISPAVLTRLVPRGTELDSWQGKTFVSMVGFRFLDTRIAGIPIPFHRNFEEVNLRFYVRRKGPDGWRRGVVFVKELVPRWAVATVARYCYNENYQALPMRHKIDQASPATPPSATYLWKMGSRWDYLSAKATGEAALPAPGSAEELITEHYWGYTTQRDGSALEYQVEHPRWPVWAVSQCGFDCDSAKLYGDAFADFFHAYPASAFIANGSEVAVHRGTRI